MSLVYISTPEATADIARRVAGDLEQRGFETYLPVRDTVNGTDPRQSIQRERRFDYIERYARQLKSQGM